MSLDTFSLCCSYLRLRSELFSRHSTGTVRSFFKSISMRFIAGSRRSGFFGTAGEEASAGAVICRVDEHIQMPILLKDIWPLGSERNMPDTRKKDLIALGQI